MTDEGRVYFLGAGASKQDRFPLTSELKHGIAWAILEKPARFEVLAAHLSYLYSAHEDALEQSSAIWTGLRQRYQGILPQARLDPRDFGQFVRGAATRGEAVS